MPLDEEKTLYMRRVPEREMLELANPTRFLLTPPLDNTTISRNEVGKCVGTSRCKLIIVLYCEPSIIAVAKRSEIVQTAP
jgi:hypothetical protein